MRALHGRLSGLCQPTYVLDIPGGHGKSPIGPSYLVAVGSANGSARYEVEDFNGRRHAYPPIARVRRIGMWLAVRRALENRVAHSPETGSQSPIPWSAACHQGLRAPHLAGAVPIEIIENRVDAPAIPVARDEPDPLARGPAPAGCASWP